MVRVGCCHFDRMLRNLMRTRFIKSTFVAGTIIIFIVALRKSHVNIRLEDGIEKEQQTVNYTNAVCALPRYDPFDPSIQQYITGWSRIDCGTPQPALTFLGKNGLLHVDRTTAAGKDLYCYFHEIIREENDDNKFELGPPQIIFDPESLPYEYNIVTCEQVLTGEVIYVTGYTQIRKVPEVIAKKSKKASKNGRVNVLIFAFDSMSRLNFIRQLPKTSKFIEERVKGVVMNGLTKVGDNTFPNMLALLSGFTAKRYRDEKALSPFWLDDSGYFDHLPTLWKNFSQNGYVTMFTEDHPKINAFNYLAHGFKEPPTDYYTRPFWLAMEDLDDGMSKDSRCYGLRPKFEFLFNYSREFSAKMQEEGHAFFSLTFLSLLSHDDINSIKIIDDNIVALFQTLEAQKVFENSVVLVMGDHGNRFDQIRRTAIGRVEERMPYLAVTLPPSLERFRNGLKANADVLTSWHDVREMLLDLAVDNLGVESKVTRHGLKGSSLLRPIPSDRTCLEIGIPREYCVCWIEQELSPLDSGLKKSAEILVNKINQIIEERDKKGLCARLQLTKVHGGQKLLPSAAVGGRDGPSDVTRIMISVSPSNALLEGTVETDANGTRIIGNVNRLNKYGSQSECVDDPALTLICFCKGKISLFSIVF
ncbi:uncharacterized protein LOC135936128 [Cloeon dipterum]|uniref:uncharacterized protein LOC135936128 n=1 Tax=Cloeon dipterum TaxID=197152 RepID=UPI003220973E